MAKISVKSKYSGEMEAPHDSWKEWIVEWVPDEIDLLMEHYDPDKGNANVATSRVSTNSELYEGSISAPPAPRALKSPLSQINSSQEPEFRSTPPFGPTSWKSEPVRSIVTPIAGFRRPAPPVADPFAARRAAARESFQRQVAASRSHVSDVLSKLGNAR